MLLQYKVPGLEELRQVKFTAGEDFNSNKKLSATWLAAMHKVTLKCYKLNLLGFKTPKSEF